MLTALEIVKKYHPSVKTVKDAKNGLDIEVTKADCKSATKKAPQSCALAKACGRMYDGAVISLSVAYLVKGTTATRYTVPQNISRELVSFDRHGEFAPGTYSLRAPSKAMRLGIKRTQPENKARYDGRTRRRAHKTAGIRAL